MDGYISKKQTIDRIASCYCMDCEHSNGILCRACEHQDDMDLIDDMPATDVQSVDRWISVDDRLPEIDERVFVYIPKPDNHYNIEIAYISEGNDDYPYWVLRDKSQFYSTRFHYISHWMPMPEPPQD